MANERVLVIDIPDELLTVRAQVNPAPPVAARVAAAAAIGTTTVPASRVGRITAPGRVT